MAIHAPRKYFKKNPQDIAQSAFAPSNTPDKRKSKRTSVSPLKQVISHVGVESSTKAHSRLLKKSAGSGFALATEALITLQRTYGNDYVQRVVDLSSQPNSDSSVSRETEQPIRRAHGGGRLLDRDVRLNMESSFSPVRVHNNAEADTLNRASHSRAFTAGQNIFSKSSEYNLLSASSLELQTHGVTRLAQEAGGNQGKLTIGQANDRYEQKAPRVAREAIRRKQHPDLIEEVQASSLVQRQEEQQAEQEGENKKKASVEKTSIRSSMIDFTGDEGLAAIFEEAPGELDVLIHSRATEFLLHGEVSADVNQLVKEVIGNAKFKAYLTQMKGKRKTIRLIACSAGGKAADVPWAAQFAKQIRRKTGFNKKQLRIKAAQNIISTIQHPGGPNGEWVSEWRIIGGGKWRLF